MMQKRTLLIFVIPLLLLSTGCARNLQGDAYSRDDARQTQTVQYGTIEDVRLVVIEGTKSPIGSIAGAAIGGIAGSGVGGGKGSQVAAVIGAVAGGLAGAAAEEGLTKSQGEELIIRIANSNKVIAIVQAHNPSRVFSIGDRVRLMTVNGEVRVAQ
jgi:outer membrane lipoprotein SlyB